MALRQSYFPERAAGQRTGSVVDPVWRSPPSKWILSKGQVHVWRAMLDVSECRLREQRRTLSADELSRAERFVFARDRRRFIAAHGTLRIILGRYLELDPCLLHFSYGRWGKPFLSPMPGHRDLTFNLSHSDGLALYAVAVRRQVGIDVERICAVEEMEQIAGRFFSASEIDVLHTLDGTARQKAFFGFWTRQEAYAKARGEGLAASPGQSESLPLPGESPAIERKRWGTDAAACWVWHELNPGPGYAAALVVEGLDCQVECWQVPDVL